MVLIAHRDTDNVLLSSLLLGSAGSKNSGSAELRRKNGEENEAVLALYEMGMQAGMSKDYRTALGYFQRAYQKDRKNKNILAMLAFIQNQLGMIDEARMNYSRVLKSPWLFARAEKTLRKILPG